MLPRTVRRLLVGWHDATAELNAYIASSSVADRMASVHAERPGRLLGRSREPTGEAELGHDLSWRSTREPGSFLDDGEPTSRGKLGRDVTSIDCSRRFSLHDVDGPRRPHHLVWLCLSDLVVPSLLWSFGCAGVSPRPSGARAGRVFGRCR